MTIAHLFKKYERWNPVHPTYGAFWGLGIGVGCGVGWGPGFGPEVIGYVGAGCGVGFSVGVTLAGFGIGLPASGLTCVPYKAISATGNGMFDFAKHSAAPTIAHCAQMSRDYVAPHISNFERRAHEGLSKLVIEYSLLWNRHAINAQNTVKDQLSTLRHCIFDRGAKVTGFFSFDMPRISPLPQIMHRSGSSKSKDN